MKTQLELSDAARELALTLVGEKSALKVQKAVIDKFGSTGLDEDDYQPFFNEVVNIKQTRENLSQRFTITEQKRQREAQQAAAKKQ